jgi:recombination associated protein RdgC
MSLIRNAIVYKASLPSAEALAMHLGELPFKPIGESFAHSQGFVPNPVTAELVTPLAGGLSFTFRRDDKILPALAVQSAIAAEVAAAEEGLEYPLEGDELSAVEERVYAELVGKALHGTRMVTGFYHPESRMLVLPTTNRKLAGSIVGALVQACGVVETSTIHVSDVKHGLTSRLGAYFRDDLVEVFDGFTLGDSVLMKGKAGTVSFDLDKLESARRGVQDALDSELIVERLQLVREQVAFKLTANFHLRSIDFLGEPTEAEMDEAADWDAPYRWRHEAGVQLIQVVDVMEQLCKLFNYQEKKPLGGEQVPQGI